MNPSDPWAWVGLVGDLIDVAVPFVGGLGETVRAIKGATQATEILDKASDTKKAWKVSEDIVQKATTGSSNSIGKIGEQLAGINPKAKQPIQVNGRTRIPDALTETALIEVKNVKYISNTSQLRDFATYANNNNLSKILYVRPSTKVAKTVIDAGWEIRHLW